MIVGMIIGAVSVFLCIIGMEILKEVKRLQTGVVYLLQKKIQEEEELEKIKENLNRVYKN